MYFITERKGRRSQGGIQWLRWKE